MAASWDVTVIDASLDEIVNNATAMNLCEGEPLNFTEATTDKPTGKRLATVAIAGGDWTKQNASSGSGREIEVAQKSTTVSVSGTADHIAFVSGSVLLAVCQMTSQAITQGNPVQYPATGTLKQFNRELTTI